MRFYDQIPNQVAWIIDTPRRCVLFLGSIGERRGARPIRLPAYTDCQSVSGSFHKARGSTRSLPPTPVLVPCPSDRELDVVVADPFLLHQVRNEDGWGKTFKEYSLNIIPCRQLGGFHRHWLFDCC